MSAKIIKAVEMPMDDCDLRINVGTDGAWLHFKTSTGLHLSLNVNVMAELSLRMEAHTLKVWCEDRRKQANEIIATNPKEYEHDGAAQAVVVKPAERGGNSEKEPNMLTSLDKAWGEINAMGGTCHEDDDHGRGVVQTVMHALGIIEDLGGMDPLQRARDNGPFGVGA